MCSSENKTIKVILENGTVKTNLELTGVKGVKDVINQVFNSFLDSIEDDGEIKKDDSVMEEMKKAYEEVAAKARIEIDLNNIDDSTKDGNIDSTVEDSTSRETNKTVEDNWVKPISNQLDKYNKEFPKLQDALSRNLYNKLTELQLNQLSYFVTDNGVLKLQARYSCSCGNFKKAWIPYPTPKKFARCGECAKINTLVNVRGEFPSIDEFGNFYVTSNMIKPKPVLEASY